MSVTGPSCYTGMQHANTLSPYSMTSAAKYDHPGQAIVEIKEKPDAEMRKQLQD